VSARLVGTNGGLALMLAPTTEARRWDDACRASGQPVTAFHTYRWLTLAAAMTGTKFLPLVVISDGDDVGVAPLLIRRRGVLSFANWVPFPYLGPLVPAALLGACLDALQGVARRQGVIRQQQSFPPGGTVDVEALGARGFSTTEDQTYVVDTRRSEEELWAALERRCRKAIRKAEREGVRIRDAVDGGALGAAVQGAFAARGLHSGYRDPFPPSPERLAGLGLVVRYVVAIQEERVLGSVVAFAHDGAALLWQGGVPPGFRGTQANVLLHWDAICWARRIGAHSFDLVGLPDEGIGRFKSQFGGSLQQYTVAQRNSALARVIERPRHPARARLARAALPRRRHA
jgi:hypothetical protein